MKSNKNAFLNNDFKFLKMYFQQNIHFIKNATKVFQLGFFPEVDLFRQKCLVQWVRCK